MTPDTLDYTATTKEKETMQIITFTVPELPDYEFVLPVKHDMTINDVMINKIEMVASIQETPEEAE